MSNEGNIKATEFIHTVITTFENCKEVRVNTENLRTRKTRRTTKFYKDGKIVTGQLRYEVDMFLTESHRISETTMTTEYK